MNNEQQCREAFEAWYISRGGSEESLERKYAEYISLYSEDAYHQFKAGYNAKAQESQWVSVDDRLPEFNNRGYSEAVLTADYDGRVWAGYCNASRTDKWRWEDGEHPLIGVTHWMPLPSPPKEQKEK